MLLIKTQTHNHLHSPPSFHKETLSEKEQWRIIALRGFSEDEGKQTYIYPEYRVDWSYWLNILTQRGRGLNNPPSYCIAPLLLRVSSHALPLTSLLRRPSQLYRCCEQKSTRHPCQSLNSMQLRNYLTPTSPIRLGNSSRSKFGLSSKNGFGKVKCCRTPHVSIDGPRNTNLKADPHQGEQDLTLSPGVEFGTYSSLSRCSQYLLSHISPDSTKLLEEILRAHFIDTFMQVRQETL